MKKYALLLWCCLALSAHAMEDTSIVTPLHDFNMVRKDIPMVLQQSLENPFKLEPPQEWTCDNSAARLDELDNVLGPDNQAPDKGLSKEVSKFVRNQISDFATGWLPFRGMVRRVTGSAAHDEKVAASWRAGERQRAYLYGWREARECAARVVYKPVAPPAAPVATPSEKEVRREAN